MNKIKVSEASGPVLDYLVAKCEVWPMDHWYDEDQLPMIRDDEPAEYKPSTDWSLAGPIIEREEIFLAKSILGGWTGSIMTHDERVRCTLHEAPTPLIAAMRCYVASKLGEEVEVPEELK